MKVVYMYICMFEYKSSSLLAPRPKGERQWFCVSVSYL